MDMENRKVVVYKYRRNANHGYHEEPKVEIGKGKLLAFGIDYKELTGLVGTFSTAIVEMDDGSVKNVAVENIKFEEITSPHEGNFENLRKCGERILNDLKREESLSGIDDYFKREGEKHTPQNLKDIADMFEAAHKKGSSISDSVQEYRHWHNDNFRDLQREQNLSAYQVADRMSSVVYRTDKKTKTWMIELITNKITCNRIELEAISVVKTGYYKLLIDGRPWIVPQSAGISFGEVTVE